MRVFIVDDEKPARGILSYQLKKIAGVEIIGASGNPVEAIDLINQNKPDLVLLDIDMPELSGFEMLPYLTCKPMVVFCTAYDEFAIKAFEVNALDYLLKPVMFDRLEKSLARAKREWNKLYDLKDGDGQPMGLRKFLCAVGNEHKVIPLEEVHLIFKSGRYSTVCTKDQREYLTDLTMEYLEEHLTDPKFFRVSRSQIVHAEHVVSFKKNQHGTLDIAPSFGEPIQVSRRRAKDFVDWLMSQT